MFLRAIHKRTRPRRQGMKMTRYRLALIVVIVAIIVALLIIGVYLLKNPKCSRTNTFNTLSYEVTKMSEHYIRVTYDGDSDPNYSVEVSTDDYWAYREIAEFVQKAVMEKQRAIYTDARAEEKST